MPFTLAHPAVVWPLRRVPRQQIVPLIVGSLAPDLPSFMPGRISERHFLFTHAGVAGSVLEDLPLGMALLVALVVLRGPLTELAGGRTRALLAQSLTRFAGSPVNWLLSPLSVLVGTWSHLLADSFTHETGRMVQHLAVLRAQVDLGFYAGPLNHILQYVLSVIGLVVVGLWYRHSAARLSIAPGDAMSPQGRRLRQRLLVAVAVAALLIGVGQAAGPAHGQALYRVFYYMLTRPIAWFGLLYLAVGTLLWLGRVLPWRPPYRGGEGTGERSA